MLKQLGLLLCATALTVAPAGASTIVRFETVLGDIDVRLFDTATPLTVANFLSYANQQEYDNTLIHRSVPGFIVQGGGWRFDGTAQVEPDNYPRVVSRPPVQNEPVLSNQRGTIAFAKLPAVDNQGNPVPGGGPDSATNQWFFNLADNAANLDNQNGGFSPFGRILGDGLEVVDAIAALPRFAFQGAWGTAPIRNYTSEEYQSFTPVDGDNVVLIERVRVLDIVDGDYNLDGVVDLADYTVWRDSLGSTTDSEADGNGNGVVDVADYALWQTNFGQAAGAVAVSVPEPAGLLLLGLAAFAIPRRRA